MQIVAVSWSRHLKYVDLMLREKRGFIVWDVLLIMSYTLFLYLENVLKSHLHQEISR